MSRCGRAGATAAPPIWMPIVGSKESIEFAASHNIPITPGLGRARGLRDDIIRYYATCLSEGRPPHYAGPFVAGHHRLCRGFEGAGVARIRAAHPLFQSHTVQSRQFHRGRQAARDRLCERGLDRLRAAGEFARGAEFCARNSAT
jgi:hypothetical protein